MPKQITLEEYINQRLDDRLVNSQVRHAGKVVAQIAIRATGTVLVYQDKKKINAAAGELLEIENSGNRLAGPPIRYQI